MQPERTNNTPAVNRKLAECQGRLSSAPFMFSRDEIFSWEVRGEDFQKVDSCVHRWELPREEKPFLPKNRKRFSAFIGPPDTDGKRHHDNVTIKFNYAIKLYLIAKCVACGSRFLWRDWLNEINGLLSIFGLFTGRFPCRLPICGGKWTPGEHLHKRVKRSCKFQSKYLHFHLYMPTAVSIIQFSRVCFWYYKRPRTTTCFVFDLDQPRYWSARYCKRCCCVFLAVAIKVSAIDSQRIPNERKTRCAVSDGEEEMENLFLDNSVGRDIKETMKIDWWVSEWNGMGIRSAKAGEKHFIGERAVLNVLDCLHYREGCVVNFRKLHEYLN